MFPDRHDERQEQRITAEETRRLQCTDAPTQSPTISPIAKNPDMSQRNWYISFGTSVSKMIYSDDNDNAHPSLAFYFDVSSGHLQNLKMSFLSNGCNTNNPIPDDIVYEESREYVSKINDDVAKARILVNLNTHNLESSVVWDKHTNTASYCLRADLYDVETGYDGSIVFAEAYVSIHYDMTAEFKLDIGSNHGCYVASNGGLLYCWGDGLARARRERQRERSLQSETNPVQVMEGHIVKKVVIGATHNFALSDDGWWYCWGENSHGQCGIDTYFDQYVPARAFADIEGYEINQMVLGLEHTCALLVNGKSLTIQEKNTINIYHNHTLQINCTQVMYIVGVIIYMDN